MARIVKDFRSMKDRDQAELLRRNLRATGTGGGRATRGHRVGSVAAPGMTSAKASGREPRTGQRTVHTDRFDRVVGTGGLVAAADGALSIRRRAYLGHAWEYTLDAPWGEVLVLAPTREKPLATGARVNLRIDPDAAIPLGAKPA